MVAPILDHLWQSTVILCLAGVLTLLLRQNSAGARYWLWFTASVKFLIPLSLVTALISRLPTLPVGPVLSPPPSELAQWVSEPFIQGPSLHTALGLGSAALPGKDLSTILLAIWGVGYGAVLLFWFVRWRRIRQVLSSAKVLITPAQPVPLYESPTLIEPGLVGIWNPVILLPAGLAGRLTSAEMRGILAHELCHYRRRDNLTSAVHMLVEALFWFYPPIW
jgi:beta-lactamase regulating signal transducer with metallopeptidase domain